MASVIWFCGDRSGNFLGLKNSLHYWILVLSHKQIVLLTLLTKLWEKYLDVNVAIDVLEKQVSENAGASFFFFFLFFFCTCPFRKVVQSPRRSYRRLWKLGKRIMTTLIVCKWVLWWTCSLFLRMTKMTHSVDHVLAVWQWCNFSPNWGPWFSYNYTCVLKSKYSEEFSTVDKVGCEKIL